MPARLGLAVFLLTVGCYLFAAAPVPFYNKGEPREGLVVRAILEGHGVILPRRDGREMPSKPPLFHWLAALAVRAGVVPEELAMRMPSIVLGAGVTAVVAGLAAQAGGAAAGVLAAAALASSLEWLRGATESRVDMTLTACLVAAMLLWRAGLASDGRRGLVRLGWLAAALAVLAKGPVGLVLPLLVVGVDALVAREPRRLLRLVDVPGVVGAAILSAGWYVLAWRIGGTEFLTRQILHENLSRFGGGAHAAHAHGPLYYLPVLAGGFFPWTLALPAVVVRLWRGRTADERSLLVWIATVLLFYSAASGKRAPYLLPLYPPLALLTGATLAPLLARPVSARGRAVLLAGTAALAAVALAIGLGGEGRIAGWLTPVLSKSDRAHLPPTLAVIAGQRAGLALTLGTAAACLAMVAARRAAVGALAVVALVWTVGLARFGTYPLALRLTPRPFGERMQALVGPGDRLCAHAYVDFPVRYYLRRPFDTCGTADAAGRTFILRAASRDARRARCYRRVPVEGVPAGLELVERMPDCRRQAGSG